MYKRPPCQSHPQSPIPTSIICSKSSIPHKAKVVLHQLVHLMLQRMDLRLQLHQHLPFLMILRLPAIRKMV